MVLKTVRADNREADWFQRIASLHETANRFSDVNVCVGSATFPCHRLILALKSAYFKTIFYPMAAQTPVQQIILEDTLPEDFQNILRYIYKSEITLDRVSVGRVLKTAHVLRVDKLKETCFRFMIDTLDPDNCIHYWKIAEDEKNSEIQVQCLDFFASKFLTLTRASNLKDISQRMMEAALQRDDLIVDSETDVCETLLRWFDAKSQNGQTFTPFPLLSLVRWSAVSVEYIKSKLTNRDVLMSDRKSLEFLSKVVSYRLSGVQFEGLLTRHRTSTGIETCALIIGDDTGYDITPDCVCAGLQRPISVNVARIPTWMQYETAACVNENFAYVTGIGPSCNETWRWDVQGGWTKCADMVEGRRRHCAAFVGSTSMYALGGYADSKQTTLSSIECFDTAVKSKWTTVGKLAHAVCSAGCAAHKKSLYMFGGMYNKAGRDICIDCIQVFNAATRQCTVLKLRLPQPECLFRAASWDKFVILINRGSCLIFDVDNQTIQQRDQFAAGVDYFGLVVDSQLLFIVGGGKDQKDADGNTTWTCTDEVKSVSVTDIVNNRQPPTWIHHSKLTSPNLVHAYAAMTLPVKS